MFGWCLLRAHQIVCVVHCLKALKCQSRAAFALQGRQLGTQQLHILPQYGHVGFQASQSACLLQIVLAATSALLLAP